MTSSIFLHSLNERAFIQTNRKKREKLLSVKHEFLIWKFRFFFSIRKFRWRKEPYNRKELRLVISFQSVLLGITASMHTTWLWRKWRNTWIFCCCYWSFLFQVISVGVNWHDLTHNVTHNLGKKKLFRWCWTNMSYSHSIWMNLKYFWQSIYYLVQSG